MLNSHKELNIWRAEVRERIARLKQLQRESKELTMKLEKAVSKRYIEQLHALDSRLQERKEEC